MERRVAWYGVCVLIVWAMSVVPVATAQATFTEATDWLNQPELPVESVVGASAVDVNQDGRVDVFRPGTLYFNQGPGRLVNSLITTGIPTPPATTMGITWGDANADGFLDALVVPKAAAPVLYINQRNGRYEPDTSSTFARGTGNIWGDFDGDGAVDVLNAALGLVTLHLNRGAGHFEARVVAVTPTVPFFMCTATAADYDKDGDLDVFVGGCDAESSLIGPRPPMQNALLRNRGDGSFDEVADAVGLLSEFDIFNQHQTLTALWFDFNNDGWLDLYEVSRVSGRPVSLVGMSRLFQNNQDGTFSDVTATAGIAGTFVDRPPTAVAGDFDNDGWVDLYVGLVEGRLDYYYHNNGDGTFSQADANIPLHNPTSLATADVNGDGWLDIFTGFSMRDRLWLNDGTGNHWFVVNARSASANRFGVGATVEVFTSEGRYMRRIYAGEERASHSHALRAHFGLGAAQHIDSVVVHWPGGAIDRIQDLAVDQEVTVVEGGGLNAPPTSTLVFPPHNSRVDPEQSDIELRWSGHDAEGRSLVYNLSIRGVRVDTTFDGLRSEELTLPTALFQRDREYEWHVTATDGFSVRRSDVFTFTFGEPPVPALQVVSFPLTNVHSGGLDFGDFDGDADPDLVVTGRTDDGVRTGIFRLDDVVFETVIEEDTLFNYAKLYRSIPTVLPGTEFGGTAWVDYDDDGDLDIFLHGRSEEADGAGPSSRLFQNTRSVFREVRDTPFAGIVYSAADWSDYDGDGDMDVIVTGATAEEPPYAPITHIYQNQGGTFVPVNIDLPGYSFGDVAWGDYDNDGDLDLAMMGDLSQGAFHAHIYRNEGANRFVKTSIDLEGLALGRLDWGDYDGDGDLDLLLTGSQMDPRLLRGQTRIYRNDGMEHFVALPAVLPHGVLGTARWGDYDLDGDLDIVAMSAEQPYIEPRTVLYRNNEGQFLPDVQVVGYLYNDLAFTDYNADGDMDVILVGRDAERKPVLRFFVNCFVPEFLPDDLVGEEGGCP